MKLGISDPPSLVDPFALLIFLSRLINAVRSASGQGIQDNTEKFIFPPLSVISPPADDPAILGSLITCSDSPLLSLVNLFETGWFGMVSGSHR